MKKVKFETYCFSAMRVLYRKWKYSLHMKYMKYSTNEERLQNIPQGLTREGWKLMFAVFSNEEFLINFLLIVLYINVVIFI